MQYRITTQVPGEVRPVRCIAPDYAELVRTVAYYGTVGHTVTRIEQRENAFSLWELCPNEGAANTIQAITREAPRTTYRLCHWRKLSDVTFDDWRHARAISDGTGWKIDLSADELVAFINDHQDVRILTTPFDGGLPLIYITTDGWGQR